MRGNRVGGSAWEAVGDQDALAKAGQGSLRDSPGAWRDSAGPSRAVGEHAGGDGPVQQNWPAADQGAARAGSAVQAFGGWSCVRAAIR